MLNALSRVVKKEALFCIHVEHGLRPAEESRGDADFVRDFCKKLGIRCRVVSIPSGKIASFATRNGTGIEAAARFFRRRAFFRAAARFGEKTFILTAHTKDDMLETALMRVLRGAGPGGLAAMPALRGQFLRPLLNMTRADVVAYLTEKNIPLREDSTNADEMFLRNRIRQRLVPLLNESFPSWKTGVCNMAETQSLTADFIGNEARLRVKWEGASTDAENFFAQPQIVREEALFQGIDLLLEGAKNPRPVRRSVVRRFCAGFAAAVDLGAVKARREGGRVLLSRGRKVFYESGFSLLIKNEGLYTLKKTSIEVRPCAQEPQNREENGGFLAVLPLVLRRSFNDDFLVCNGKKVYRRNLKGKLISAADKLGTAAFIGQNGVLFARDFPPENGDGFNFFRFKRIFNV